MFSHNLRGVVIVILLAGGLLLVDQPVRGEPGESPRIVHAVLNRLQIDIDSRSGSILKLSYPGAGTILETTPEKAGILDLACPLADFEPFRLGSKYSTGAKVEKTERAVTITWDALGGSRPFPFAGKVAAVVRLLADTDGRSVVINCTIKNQSQRAIPQVLFPDLNGFVPIAGGSETRFRSGGFVKSPFRDLKRPENGGLYADPGGSGDAEFYAKCVYDGTMLIRWFDYGNLQGGLSCWQRSWGYEPEDVAGGPLCKVRMELDEFETKLRLMWMHAESIAPGGTWQSRDYVLTPHKAGWANGIETYRQWVKKNQKRLYPVPKHIRGSLGMRSVFMCNWQPRDGDRDVLWRFADLPKIADECKEYGLNEMVPWFWHDHFQLPMPPPFEHLGGKRQFAQAVAECKRKGINVAPFISVAVLANPTAARYGLGIGGQWTYHPELLPKISAYYAGVHNTGQVDTGNPTWQGEVLSGCKQMIDDGTPSICWDVFITRKEEPNLFTLTRKIRELAKQKDPESSFSGESCQNVELESECLDYTWNWAPSYLDCRAFTSAYSAPRININVDHSVPDAVLCFMDNLFLNVMPRKTPYAVNGTGTIGQYPEFSKALKRCADRRRQFLGYFTDGTLVGECLLSQDCPGAHVTSYVLPGKALLLVLNQADRRSIGFRCDLAPWLNSPSGRYQIDCYDMDGRRLKTIETSADWSGVTHELERNGVAIFEIKAAAGQPLG
jgi:hypothetical protein